MIWRVLQYGFLVVGVVLLGAAAVAYYYETDEPGALIENAETELPPLKVGENVVTFRAHNPTRHAVRVVGLSNLCGRNCCIGPKDDIPFVIPPGGTKDLQCVVDAKRSGPVEIPVCVFFDDLGLRRQEFQVHGTVR